MNQGVCPCFQPDEDQRDYRQHDLQALRSLLLCGPFPPPPLRRRTIPQMPHPCNYGYVHYGPKGRHNQHWNAYRILMPPPCGCIDPAYCCQSRKPDGYSNTADRKNGRTEALQHRQRYTRPAHASHRLRIDEKSIIVSPQTRVLFFELQCLYLSGEALSYQTRASLRL